MELLILAFLLGYACLVIYRKIKRRTQGCHGCSCGSCPLAGHAAPDGKKGR